MQILCFFAVTSLILLSCGCTQQPAGSPATPAAVTPVTSAAGNPVVRVTQPDASHIVITYPGSPQTDKLVELEISVTDSSGRVKTESMGSRLATTPVRYGGTHTITGSFEGEDRVFITGYFSDGSQKPIIDTTI
jgi:uncharacterized secreted protein with C-terminal beta-propeller domain